MRFLFLLSTGVTMWMLSGCGGGDSKESDEEDVPKEKERLLVVDTPAAKGLFSEMRERVLSQSQLPDSPNSLAVSSHEYAWNPLVKEIMDQMIRELEELPETKKFMSRWNKESPEFIDVGMALVKPILSFGKSVLLELVKHKAEIMQAYRSSLAPNQQAMIERLPLLKDEIDAAYDELFGMLDESLTRPLSFRKEGPSKPALTKLAMDAQRQGLGEEFRNLSIECRKIIERETLRIGTKFLPPLVADTLMEIGHAKSNLLAKYPNNERVQTDVPLLADAMVNGFKEFMENV
jgi:hypothetical protein